MTDLYRERVAMQTAGRTVKTIDTAIGSVAHVVAYGTATTVTEVTVWDLNTAYAYLAAASVLKVSSADAADDAAGTGARTLQIAGLNSSYAEISETVTLDGQTEVNTTNSYLRVHSMQVLTAGSGGVNAGIVYAGTGTVTAGVPAVKYAAMNIGTNRTAMGVYTVPAGKTALCYALFANGQSDKTTTLRVKSRDFGAAFVNIEKVVIKPTPVAIQYPIPITFEAKTDIEIMAGVDATTGVVSARLALMLLDNSALS